MNSPSDRLARLRRPSSAKAESLNFGINSGQFRWIAEDVWTESLCVQFAAKCSPHPEQFFAPQSFIRRGSPRKHGRWICGPALNREMPIEDQQFEIIGIASTSVTGHSFKVAEVIVETCQYSFDKSPKWWGEAVDLLLAAISLHAEPDVIRVTEPRPSEPGLFPPSDGFKECIGMTPMSFALDDLGVAPFSGTRSYEMATKSWLASARGAAAKSQLHWMVRAREKAEQANEETPKSRRRKIFDALAIFGRRRSRIL